MVHFEKKRPEIKKKTTYLSPPPPPPMTNFYNFNLKMETIWAKKVLKPIL